MPSYFITGSRGIAAEFAKEYSEDPSNVVFCLVRNPASPLIWPELKERKNIHLIEGDITDLTALRNAVKKVAEVTGGSLDVLINNAAWFDPKPDTFKALSEFQGSEEGSLTEDFNKAFQTNVLGPVYVTNTFLPLLRKSTLPLKKVIMISSAAADIDFVRTTDYPLSVPYGASKAALNLVVSKYATEAELRKDGLVFLAVGPGFVNTVPAGFDHSMFPPEVQKGFGELVVSFQRYRPDLKMPDDYVAPEVSVGLMRALIEKVTLEDSGAFVSQFGNKQWL